MAEPQAISVNIHCIVLAAGASSRFGATKLLSRLDGESLLTRALSAAQGVCSGHVCLVVGCNSAEIVQEASGLADSIAENPDYRRGIGSSIACGMRACRSNADAVIVMLADQPLVTAAHIAHIIDRWDEENDVIVATRFSGIDGPPVLFGRDYFDQLERLDGDAGAKSVLRAHPGAVRAVTLEQAAIDIDTPDDLAALLSRNQHR